MKKGKREGQKAPEADFYIVHNGLFDAEREQVVHDNLRDFSVSVVKGREETGQRGTALVFAMRTPASRTGCRGEDAPPSAPPTLQGSVGQGVSAHASGPPASGGSRVWASAGARMALDKQWFEANRPDLTVAYLSGTTIQALTSLYGLFGRTLPPILQEGDRLYEVAEASVVEAPAVEPDVLEWVPEN